MQNKVFSAPLRLRYTLKACALHFILFTTDLLEVQAIETTLQSQSFS